MMQGGFYHAVVYVGSSDNDRRIRRSSCLDGMDRAQSQMISINLVASGHNLLIIIDRQEEVQRTK